MIGCHKQETKNFDSPISDLGHIDVILDSTAWYAIQNDSFIQNEFGILNQDTAYYGGKPSFDFYLLGNLNFLHFSLNKGYWNNQEGGGVLVFQTQKPDQKELLLNSWKQHYSDSLFVHTYTGTEFKLDEIMAWYEKDTTKLKEATMFANLTTYSAEAYKNWGISDSIIEAGLAMQEFMKDWGGETLNSRLFNSITALYMTINAQEYKEIKSALTAVGYEEKDKLFTHTSNPPIYISISEQIKKSKYDKVKFKLNHSISEKEIVFGPMAKLMLKDDEAWFEFK